MLREDHCREDEPRKTYEEQQHEVEAPEASALHEFNDCYAHDDEGHQQGADGGRERKLLLDRVVEHRDDGLRGAHELHGVGNDGTLEVVHEVEGQELLFAHVRGPVGFQTEQEVVAQLRPRVVLGVLVCELAERRPVGLSLVGGLHRAENHVARLRRTIIIEDVIAIDAILRSVVLLDGLREPNLFLGRDVQLLLDDAPPLVGIGAAEVVVGLNAHEVVGESEDEAKDEMRLAHVEDAVVHRHIDSLFAVDVVNGRVSIEAIRLLSGLAGEQADADGGVHTQRFLLRQSGLSIGVCSGSGKEQKEPEMKS